MALPVVGALRRHPFAPLLAAGHLRRLILGSMLSAVGDGMAVVAVPWLALDLAGGVGEGLAVGAAATALYATGIPVALAFSLGRRRFDPRRVLIADCLLRGGAFAAAGGLAAAGLLPLWGLIGLLALSATTRTLALTARRLIATDLVGPDRLLAVNSLLFTQFVVGTTVLGPALGGVLTGAIGPGAVLLLDGATFAPLLVVALLLPATRKADGGEEAGGGVQALRRHPTVVALLSLVFLFDLLYGPVEVAMPIHVDRNLGDAGTLGLLWTGFGVGSIVGSLLAGLAGRLPERRLLIGIVAGWAAALAGFAASPEPWPALVAMALGGLVYAPFTPVTYTMVQNRLSDAEQQPVLTLWGAVVVTALPLGTAVGGPLVASLGATGALWASSLATLALAALAALATTGWRRGRSGVA